MVVYAILSAHLHALKYYIINKHAEIRRYKHATLRQQDAHRIIVVTSRHSMLWGDISTKRKIRGADVHSTRAIIFFLANTRIAPL